MRTSDARDGLRVLSAAALLIAASAGWAESSEITANIGYGTTGAIESGGVTGAPVVSFQGVGDGTLTTGGTPFDLGRFVVAPLPIGTSTTYHNTPFEVFFLAQSLDGVPTAGMQPVVIQGWLNGTVTGAGASNVVANLNLFPGDPGDDGRPHIYPSITGPFAIGGLTNYLDQTDGFAGLLSPNGSTSFQGVMYPPQIAPEPTSFAIFACLAVLPILLKFRGTRGVR